MLTDVLYPAGHGVGEPGWGERAFPRCTSRALRAGYLTGSPAPRYLRVVLVVAPVGAKPACSGYTRSLKSGSGRGPTMAPLVLTAPARGRVQEARPLTAVARRPVRGARFRAPRGSTCAPSRKFIDPKRTGHRTLFETRRTPGLVALQTKGRGRSCGPFPVVC